MGLPGKIGPTDEKRYLEAIWEELLRVGRTLNYHNKQQTNTLLTLESLLGQELESVTSRQSGKSSEELTQH